MKTKIWQENLARHKARQRAAVISEVLQFVGIGLASLVILFLGWFTLAFYVANFQFLWT